MKSPSWWTDAFSEVNAALGLLATFLLATAVFSWAVNAQVAASWLISAAVAAVALIFWLMYRKAARERDGALGVDTVTDTDTDTDLVEAQAASGAGA